MSEANQFKPEELCSSKLWEIVRARAAGDCCRAELEAAVAELARRRHYLAELAELDAAPRPECV